jgi:DUF1680 family protein
MKFQDADGYLGSYADKDFIYIRDREACMKKFGWLPNWSLWNRKYCIWGMFMAYKATGDKAILASVEKQMNQWIDSVRKAGVPMCDLDTPGMNGMPSMSILKPLLMIYEETGNRKYLDFASEILPYWDRDDGRKPNFFRNAPTGKALHTWYPEPQNWAKSYEMMSCLDGILEYARVTGDARSLDTVKAIRENLFRTELNVLGDVGYVDQFFGAANQPNACSELCDTVHWIRLNLDLYLMTGDKRYCDAMEIAYYNAFLAGIFRDGAWAAFAMRGAVRHEHDRQCGYAYNHCCVNNAARTWMDMAEGAVTVDGQGVYHVNFYQDATVALDGVTFEISGGYPVGGTVKVKTSKPVKVAFRKPAWCPKMDVSGSGCEHKLVFDMNPRLLDGPDTVRAEKNTWHYSRYLCRHQSPKDAVCETYRSEPAATIMYGPLLLAKSIRTGATRAELTDMSSVRGKGYSLKLTPSKGDGVWAAWDVELAKPGAPTIKTRACDYQSAGDSPYSSTAVCFSVWF